MNQTLASETPRLRSLRWRWDGEEGRHIAVLVPKIGGVYLLNPTAALVFAGCDGKTTIGEIAQRLAAEYGIDRELALADTMRVIALWRELDMMES